MDINKIKSNLENKFYKKPYELTTDLQKIDIDSLRSLATNLNLSILNSKGKKKRTRSLIELILDYWRNNNCSLETPCTDDKSCHVESGTCISNNLIKKEILDPRTGNMIQVVGTESQISEAESSPNMPSELEPPNNDPIISYLTESFIKEGMTDVTGDGNCFFECISNLVRLTTDPSSKNNNLFYRNKILDTVYLLTQGENPIISPINLLLENSELSTDPGELSNQDIDDGIKSYITTMKQDSEWAGEPEIIASCNLFNKIIIIRHLRKFVPDKIYFPDENIRSGKSILPGYWILYHVNHDDDDTDVLGNHYQYNNKSFRSGTLTSLNNLLEIIDKINVIDDVSPSMSIITTDGKTFAGSSDDLQSFSKEAGLQLAFTNSDEISVPIVNEGIRQPNEEEEDIENYLNNNSKKHTDTELQNEINRFLYS